MFKNFLLFKDFFCMSLFPLAVQIDTVKFQFLKGNAYARLLCGS